MRFECGILKQKKTKKKLTKNIENKYMQEYDKHANILAFPFLIPKAPKKLLPQIV